MQNQKYSVNESLKKLLMDSWKCAHLLCVCHMKERKTDTEQRSQTEIEMTSVPITVVKSV